MRVKPLKERETPDKEMHDMVRLKRKHPGPGTGSLCPHYSSRQKNHAHLRVHSGRHG